MLDSSIIVALVGLFSALLGGWIQAISARRFERQRFESQSKWELYSKYFNILGELSFTPKSSERQKNAMAAMAELRGRIGIVGSPEVIEAVGNVFKHKDLGSSEAQAAMAAALDAMRRDVGAKGRKVSQAAFVQLMFGSRDRD